MQDLIQRLRQIHGSFNLPCNEAQMSYLKIILQGKDWSDHKAPENPAFHDLMLLFRDHNGMPISYENTPFPRMMSFEEALALRGAVSYLMKQDKLLLWDAGDSNYYGVYLHEPLAGRVFHLNHDEIDFSPLFHDVRRMYESLLMQAERNLKGISDDGWVWWHWNGGAGHLKTDYPKTVPDPQYDDEDRTAAQVYLDRYHVEQNQDMRCQYAEAAMNLLPFNVREPLEMFMDSTQASVQMRAVQTFALRHDETAIPKIEGLIRSKRVLNEGIQALAQIGTPAAIQALVNIARDIENIDLNAGFSVLRTFKLLGYETRNEGSKFSYRKSSSDQWVHFGRV